jgi:hypothetical protein
MNDVLQPRVLAHFTGAGAAPTLGHLCRHLVDAERESWPEFRGAWDSLGEARQRDITCSGFSVRVMYNPGRSINTLAAVTPEKIGQRPCFLCAANLPAEQKAVLYKDDFFILANPRPVVPYHLTIAYGAHQPQSLYASFDHFLSLTHDIAPGFTTLYNGPQCGASAPDHLHFQAIPSGHLPVEKEFLAREKFSIVNEKDGIIVSSGRGLGREIILIEGARARDVSHAFREFIDMRRPGTADDGEPMINVIGHYMTDSFRLAIFPRRAHRPAAFFREDDQRILISPAVMEMGGMIVTPSEADFNRLNAEIIEAIYREVSLMP